MVFIEKQNEKAFHRNVPYQSFPSSVDDSCCVLPELLTHLVFFSFCRHEVVFFTLFDSVSLVRIRAFTEYQKQSEVPQDYLWHFQKC